MKTQTKQKQIRCKHRWQLAHSNFDITYLFCNKCAIVRRIYEDGYEEHGKSKGEHK